MHVALLGDSVFDNGAYVEGGPDVATQLRRILAPGGSASLLAVDGATTAGVHAQLAGMRAGTSHLVVSAGGNDALGFAHVLGSPARSAGEVLLALAQVQDAFRAAYVEMLEALRRPSLPAAVCTVYDPRYPDPTYRRIAITALAVINDVILREAAARGISVLDLRTICSEDVDFANPIEPSSIGGEKIAQAIASFARAGAAMDRAQIFVR